MPAINHHVKHYYQPTNSSCSQSALAMLLSFFDVHKTPQQIMQDIPVNKDEHGDDWGSINQQLATWCIAQGFSVELHTADFEIIDLSWSKLSKTKLLERMELAKEHRNIARLGKHWSRIYMQSYIDFVQAGGNLHIHPYMSSKLLDQLLPTSPLLASVAFGVLYNRGRGAGTTLRAGVADDIQGTLVNHSIVIHGKDEAGNYLIADPWEKPGFHTIEPERLLAAMTASQVECDNLLFQLNK